jgi:hypothetical protein
MHVEGTPEPVLVLVPLPVLVVNPDPVLPPPEPEPELELEPVAVDLEPLLLHPTTPRSRPRGAAKRILELTTVKWHRVSLDQVTNMAWDKLIETARDLSTADVRLAVWRSFHRWAQLIEL